MAFAPASYISQQYEDFENYWLKMYEQGTTTPITMYNDSVGTTSFAKLEINTEGFFESSGGAIIIPHIETIAYDAWIFPTEADADANDTINATQIADNITAVDSAISSSSDFQELTTATMAANTVKTYEVGDIVTTKEFSTGNGGGGTYDVITVGTTPNVDLPNTHNIIVSAVDPTICFRLRVTEIINANQWGAQPGVDSTSATQAIQDYLTDGGKITFEPLSSPYLITAVDITNAGITVDLNNGAQLKKTGSAGAGARGIFRVQNVLNIKFQVLGGVVDLNGEGPMEIGVAGRIANTYATAAGETGISGALNALIFGLRASDIKVIGTRIINSGENGLLFRNCANVKVDKCEFENIANAGVEFSLVDAGSDGGSGTMPERGRYYVTNSNFKDIDDYKLGAGNGVGVYFNGGATNETFYYCYAQDNNFEECQRDIHVEFNNGSIIRLFDFSGNTSQRARQGSIGLIGGKNGSIRDNEIFNPGQAGNVGLNAGFPSIYGIILSQDYENVTVQSNTIEDSQNDIVQTGTGGAITSGTTTFTDAGASFVAGDVGKFIAIDGANPSTSNYVGKIVTFNSSTSVELNLNAGATVSGASYAYGGALRRGIDMTGGESADVNNNLIVAGVDSGIASEPSSAALLVTNPSGQIKVTHNIMEAPTTPGTTPSGFEASTTFTGTLINNENDVSGFTNNFNNFNSSGVKAAARNYIHKEAVQQADPDAAIDTYGTEIFLPPRRNVYSLISTMSIESSNVSAETLTATVTFYYPNSGTNSIDVTFTSNVETEISTPRLATLHENNGMIEDVGFKVKSSKASSTAFARISFVGIEG